MEFLYYCSLFVPVFADSRTSWTRVSETVSLDRRITVDNLSDMRAYIQETVRDGVEGAVGAQLEDYKLVGARVVLDTTRDAEALATFASALGYPTERDGTSVSITLD